ncbi:hypothetical protein J0X19_12320 [Hymenobacter sp. BT186]|uniref:Uncharacterized protein n=1 Tax=Hymenobacter telluris TaxID=2816474 RepID=A0A939JCU6_9BACT|nr:hypothetical protein [Hymenobacter telluris]MBO0358735.1 hypothetical protein [Hymenobacter telluris]MBW3374761.1 hypothetical protein [Hymenobacter norwichensis]
MAVRFIRDRVVFDPTKGITQTEPRTVTFPSTVRTAQIALNGFDVQYTDGDHHILRQIVDIGEPRINGNAVTYDVKLLLRDGSGNIDDRYHGTVDTLIIADTAS